MVVECFDVGEFEGEARDEVFLSEVELFDFFVGDLLEMNVELGQELAFCCCESYDLGSDES